MEAEEEPEDPAAVCKACRTLEEQAELAEGGRQLANDVMCSKQYKMFYEDFRARQRGLSPCFSFALTGQPSDTRHFFPPRLSSLWRSNAFLSHGTSSFPIGESLVCAKELCSFLRSSWQCELYPDRV
jgi:hypothetical protein